MVTFGFDPLARKGVFWLGNEGGRAESGYSRKGGREGVTDFEDCNEIFL